MGSAVARSVYPVNWPEIATAVKAEAGWRCVRCGHLDDPVRCEQLGIGRGFLPCDDRCQHEDDGRMRVLTVHHLDGDKGNCRWWNLAPLCQVCHLQVQAKVKMVQLYLHPHSDWFLPYVAGFYAFTVLGFDLPRKEVTKRLPELLAAGQPHLAEHYAERLEAPNA